MQVKNVLTVCSEGINRSQVLAAILKYRYDTIAIGVNNTKPKTLEMLYKWADFIVVTDARLLPAIPAKYSSKVHSWDVGEDRYPREYNQELLEIYHRYMEKDPLK
jgi:galactitol-specific phosphotransferase system IIB component